MEILRVRAGANHITNRNGRTQPDKLIMFSISHSRSHKTINSGRYPDLLKFLRILYLILPFCQNCINFDMPQFRGINHPTKYDFIRNFKNFPSFTRLQF